MDDGSAQNGANQEGNQLKNATGKGLNHAGNQGKKAGQKAGHLGKKALKPKNLKKGAGAGMQGVGKGMKYGGKGAKLAGKGASKAGQGLDKIPVVGPFAGVPLGVAGKGAEAGGKGAEKAGKGIDKAGKKLRKSGGGKLTPGKIGGFVVAHGWWILGLSVILVLLSIFMVSFSVATDDEGDECASTGGDTGGADTTSIAGANGDWTRKGTKAYNLAKAEWAYGRKLGWNDAETAAEVGTSECEGASSGSLDMHENPADGYDGEGIYQFTGSTKVSYLNWCKKHGFSKPFGSLHAEMQGIWGCYGMTYKDYAKKHITSIPEATHVWYHSVEMPNDAGWGSHGPKRITYARKAYDMFKGVGGSSDDVESTADSDSGSSDACSDDSGGDTADGTGSVKEKPSLGNMTWAPGKEPDDIKKYIHSPTDVGMTYGSSKGWPCPDTDGECVPFSNSYMSKIWNMHGGYAPNTPLGKVTADGWQSYMKKGGKMSTTPQAGAVAESTESWMGGNHTFVVEHVLANHDFIIAEQNWPSSPGHGGSGSHIGKPYTWNYALIGKGLKNTKFFMPDKSKYKLTWSTKK